MERTLAYPVAQTDDCVKHISREYSQDAHHLANPGAKEQRKITIEKGDNSETWQAVGGFWDGSTKTCGRSGCGVVIKGVDKEKWIRTCKKGWNPDWSQKHIQGLLDYQVNVVYEEIDKNDAVRRNALD